MKRFWASLIVACIGLGWAVGGVILVRQAKAHYIPFFYVLGPLLVVSGIGFFALHLSVSDDYLRQHIKGEKNAMRMREIWRGGWVGIPAGLALIAAQYFLGSWVPLP